MLIRVRQSVPRYIDRADDIIRWYVHKHIGADGDRDISVNLYLRWTNITDLDLSWCWPARTKNRYTVIIASRPQSTEYTFIRDVVHEMVHLKQYYTGKLKFLSTHVRYDGKNIYKDLEYQDRPWEIEAFGMESYLIEDYLDDRHLTEQIMNATVRKVIL